MAYDIKKENVEDIYPLSDMQLGMVYHSLNDQKNSAYHNQVVYQLTEPAFDMDLLKKAVLLLYDKHEMLRCVFNIYDYKEPVQIILKNITPNIEFENIDYKTGVEQEVYINWILGLDRKKIFDFINPELLWRLKVFQLNNQKICFVWVCHHAIMDGWSTASLLTELNNLYLKLKGNASLLPRKLKSTYKSFIIEERAQKKNNECLLFWKKELENYKRLDFSAEKDDSVVSNIGSFVGKLDDTWFNMLESLAKRHNITVKSICFASYMFMLNMLSYENDIVGGLVVSNRISEEDGDKVLGCFVNTIPVRIVVPKRSSWFDFVTLIHRKQIELSIYQHVSLLDLKKALGETPSEENPVFQNLFNFIDFHVYSGIVSQNKENITQDYNKENDLILQGNESTNIHLTCDVHTTGGNFLAHYLYNRQFISDNQVIKLFNYFQKVLQRILYAPYEIIDKEILISKAEKEKLLFSLNSNCMVKSEKTINELFIEQVNKTPDHIALCTKSTFVSYKELEKNVQVVSNNIKARNIPKETIIGIMSQRSTSVIELILGILSAGCVFLPVDNRYPLARKRFIIKDSNLKLLVHDSNLEPELVNDCECAPIHSFSTDIPFSHVEVLDKNFKSGAYIMYTSGSTGKPKGVLVENSSLVNYVTWAAKTYIRNERCKMPFYTSTNFDLTITSIFVPLISGNTIQVYPEYGNNYLIHDIVRDNNVDTIKLTPAHLKLICEQVDYDDRAELRNTSIKKIIVGGENLGYQLAKKVAGHFKKDIEIYNEYGPTEATVGCIVHKFESTVKYDQNIYIGKPIDRAAFLILDKYKQLVPFNVSGELYLGGDCLSRGYLNNIELTEERFTSSIYSNGQRLYKTGDIVSYSDNGEIEFIGREDHQVKISGYRIELGEIENSILKIKGIKDSVAVMKNSNGENYLCAYYVSGEEFNGELREILAKSVPEYMIPAFFIQVENIPLTLNGKVDYNALPLPDSKAIHSSREIVHPGNEAERTVASIWKEVLGNDMFGVEDNFFHVGGNSLNILRVNHKLMASFNKKIAIVDLFKYPTIKLLAQYLTKGDTSDSLADADIEESMNLMQDSSELFLQNEN